MKFSMVILSPIKCSKRQKDCSLLFFDILPCSKEQRLEGVQTKEKHGKTFGKINQN